MTIEVLRPAQSPFPQSNGIYGWWFSPSAVDELGIDPEDTALHSGHAPLRCQHIGYSLLYVGLASGQTIYTRIVKKHLRRTAVSTLRQSLAVLKGLQRSAKDCLASPDLEVGLTNWMREHCRWSWVETDECALHERKVFERIYLPLNLHGCPTTPFRARLRALRRWPPLVA